MKGAKAEVKKLLAQLPDGASYEEIQYHIYVLYVRQKIERGLKDVKDGRVLS